MKEFKLNKKVLTAAIVAGLAFCGPAHASVIYDLNFTHAGYGPGPFGKVTLTQQTDQVDVLVDLTDGFGFANTGSGPAFAFNLSSTFAGATVSLLTPSADFSVGNSGSVNPWGTFSNTIVWKKGAPTGLSGSNPVPIDPMSFSVSASGINVASFLASGQIMVGGGKGAHLDTNTGGYTFIADIGKIDGQVSGVAGATGQETDGGGGGGDQADVPEPGTIALFGLGLMGAALSRRRRET